MISRDYGCQAHDILIISRKKLIEEEIRSKERKQEAKESRREEVEEEEKMGRGKTERKGGHACRILS